MAFKVKKSLKTTCRATSKMNEKPITENLGQKEQNLLELPTVAERIMKYLSAPDLCSCAKICKSWNATAQFVKRKRNYILITAMDEDFTGNYLDLWIEPKVAICFGCPEYHNAVEAICEELLYKESIAEEDGEYRYLKQESMEFLGKANRQNQRLRRCLPRNCAVVHFVPFEWDASPFFSYFLCQALMPMMILIPSIQGVELQPFVLPHQTHASFRLRKEIDSMFLSGGTSCLKSKAKCVLVFLSSNNADNVKSKDIFIETSLGKYITDEAIIIVGQNIQQSASTGIAVSGERVKVECVSINEKMCCTKQYFAMLQSLGFGKKNGMAFLVGRTLDVDVSSIFRIWSTFFPTITLLGFMHDFKHKSVLRSTICLSHKCRECGVSLSSIDVEDSHVALVFIFIAGVICKNIIKPCSSFQ